MKLGNDFGFEVAAPVEKRLVYRDDFPIEGKGHVTTGRDVIQLLYILIDELVFKLQQVSPLDGDCSKKLRIAEMVSAGALRWGQCPLAFSITSKLLVKCL